MSVDTSTASIHLDLTMVDRPLAPVRAEVDPADLDTAEIVIYRCGTFAPGMVHEPCQHSSVIVLCCACAGCVNDVWSCAEPVLADAYAWYEADRIAEVFEPWMVHPLALILYALSVIVILTARIIPTVVEIMLSLLWLSALIASVATQSLLHRL